MPSYLDLGLIAIVLVSALLSMLRGFSREVLAIVSWVAAAAAAYYFHPIGVPYLEPYIPRPQFLPYISAAIIFFVTLILVSLITVRVSDAILDSKIGALDRSLGFLFGAGRGLLIGVVAFLFMNWLVPVQAQPEWIKNARSLPLLQSAGDGLLHLLPDDPESALQNLRKRSAEPEPANGQPVRAE